MLNRRPRRWSIPVVCAALLAVSIVPAAGAADGAGAGQSGSWQPHKYDFHFMGFTSTYSCDGLADKLQLLLRAVGARADAKVIPLCARGSGVPDKLAEASLKFSTSAVGGRQCARCCRQRARQRPRRVAPCRAGAAPPVRAAGR